MRTPTWTVADAREALRSLDGGESGRAALEGEAAARESELAEARAVLADIRDDNTEARTEFDRVVAEERD